MVEKLTQKVQTESSVSFMELFNSIWQLIAKVQQIWEDRRWYFNVGIGTVAAACAVALAMPVAFTAIEKKTTGTVFSIILWPIMYVCTPMFIIGALVYFVCQANSKLTTLDALNQSRQAIKKIHLNHQTQIEEITTTHQAAMTETHTEMSDVLGKFTDHAQEIYTQLTEQKVDFKKMGAAQEALQQLIQERVGGNLGDTLDQMNEVVAALGQITQLPENLKTIAIRLKEAQTQYDTLNKRHAKLLDRFERDLDKMRQ